MEKSVQDRFFEPVKPVVFNEIDMDYNLLAPVTKLLDCMSDILPHNAYIVDYCRKNFFYISKQSIFLCGYTHEEAMNAGYSFLSKILSPADLELLAEINDAGFKFFYQVPMDKRTDGSISYDLILHRNDGSTISVNHRLRPYNFTPDGNLWLAVCSLRPSAATSSGNAQVYFREANERYQYSFERKNWSKLPTLELSKSEIYIASETDKGTPEKHLADILSCTRSNIRYYKSQIMRKTETNSMREAILFLTSSGII